MKKSLRVISSFVLLTAILFPNISLIAQESNDVNEYKSNLKQEGLKNATLGNCFDVYKFEDINFSAGLDRYKYEPAGFIVIRGTIRNENNYPVPDLKIKAKVVKVEKQGDIKISKVVDEVIVKDNINLASKAAQDINEVYDIPIKAEKGEYEILFYVFQNNQRGTNNFNKDLYDYSSKFSITSNNEEEIVINQTGITINDEPYNNLSFNPRYKEIKPIKIKVPIQNNSSEDKEIEIQYEVYSWSDDLGQPATKLTQRQTIAKQGNSIASYTIEDIKEAVYYVKVKVKDVNTSENMRWTNIANLRFIDERVNEPRIAAVTMNTSPYSPEAEMQLVSCIHNTNESSVDTILENIIKDEKGKVIASSEYRGQVTGQVDGIYTKLPKNKRYNNIIVTSIIKDKDGNTLNTVELKYDCKELDPSKCIEEKNTIWPIIIGIASIILISVLVIIGYRVYRIKKIKV